MSVDSCGPGSPVTGRDSVVPTGPSGTLNLGSGVDLDYEKVGRVLLYYVFPVFLRNREM